MSRFEIRVPTPFRLEPTVWALRRRPHNAMDCWDGHNYRRVLMLGQRPIEVTARQDAGQGIPVLDVDLRGSGGPLGDDIVREARRILERTLGLGVDLAGFYRLADSDPRLQTLAKRFYGMRPPCFPSVFEALVNAIACQQLSLTVGIHLLNRLSERFGPTVSAGRDQPFCFPTPEGLAEADPQVLRDLGFSHAKARFVTTLAVRVASGQLDLEALREETDDVALVALLDLMGIGRWSAEYALLRGLRRWHVLPGDDVGARNNLRRRFDLSPGARYDALAELAQVWWPWGGLVYFHLLLDSLATSGLVTPSLP